MATESTETVAPPSDDTRISRYMDFPRFISMLINGGLYFASPDWLGDPDEGKLGARDIESVIPDARERFPRMHQSKAFLKWEKEIWQPQLRAVAINSWFRGLVESHAMWQRYGRGVAIESTVGLVRAALRDLPFEVRAVEYVDHDARPPTGPDAIRILSYKRRGFAHEQELRFFLRFTQNQREGLESMRLIRDPERFMWGGSPDGLEIRCSGVTVKLDLKSLVTGIVIAPGARVWESEAAFRTAVKYGFRMGIIRGSELDWDPYSPHLSQFTQNPKE